MEKRLIAIAKELNVGTSTIVEHLNKKGYQIDSSPTAKVTADMYEVLLRDFKDSITVKEQAEKLMIGTRPGMRKDSQAPQASNNDNNAQAPAANTTGKARDTFSFLRPNAPAAPAAPEPKQPEPAAVKQPEPVVAKPEEAAPKPETKVPSEVTPPVEKTETPTSVTPEETGRPQVGLKILGKVNLDPPTPPAGKSEGRKQGDSRDRGAQGRQGNNSGNSNNGRDNNQPRREGQPRNRPNEQRQQAPVPKHAPPPPPPVVEEKKPKEIIPAEVIRAETPQLGGLKIMGKVNLAEDERGGRAASKKRKREKEKLKAEKDRVTAQRQQAGDAAKRTGAPGTAAPGTAAGADDAAKRKRKRKKVVTSTNGTSGTPGTAGTQGGGQQRPHGGGGGNNTGGNQYRGGGNQNRGGTDRPRTPGGEVSQEEIQKKIRETMSRLSNTGKKERSKNRREKRDLHRERQNALDASEITNKLRVTEFISVSELASLMEEPVARVIGTCMSLGVFVSINQRIDAEVIELVVSEFGYEVEFINAEEELEKEEVEVEDNPQDLVSRAPIVTVMGHVDHGKTSLLDYIRKANVVSGEAGGITQHIGAYEVVTAKGNKITFLDTPGHEAFTAMRARGAKVTDIAVIIISADDSIMPQTREAISHAQAAGVPIIFAINKIDKDGADPERIKSQLADMNLLVEDWGGKYQSQDISAKKGLNVDMLLEKILLEAEMLELKANPKRDAGGTVVEASLDKGRGYVSKLLVQNGTLKIGDIIVAGEYSGKVRAMFNERGKKVTAAGPSTPVLVLGLQGAPTAGEKFKVYESDQEARQIASKRAQIHREQTNRASKRISLDEIGRRLALGTFKELNLIIKGDVDGSVEALADSLLKLSIESVQVNVLLKGVGQIIDSDIMLASASDAIIVGFQVRPSPTARKLAEREGVQIKTYSIIYEAIGEIKAAIEGMLEPTKEENITGQVEVREVYKISKVGAVAGCYVQEGKVTRNSFVRVIRDGIVVFPTRENQNGKIGSLKRFKDDQKEVKAGFECGITIDGFNDLEVGDTFEAYEIVEVRQKL